MFLTENTVFETIKPYYKIVNFIDKFYTLTVYVILICHFHLLIL